LFLSFIPFPTAFIGDYPKNSTALAFFAVILMSAAIVFNILWRYAIHRKLLVDSVPPALIEQSKKRGFVGPIFYAVAAMAAFLMPLIAWVIFIAIPIYYFLPMKWIQKT
jgi:uncharacterized membrane protein